MYRNFSQNILWYIWGRLILASVPNLPVVTLFDDKDRYNELIKIIFLSCHENNFVLLLYQALGLEIIAQIKIFSQGEPYGA